MPMWRIGPGPWQICSIANIFYPWRVSVQNHINRKRLSVFNLGMASRFSQPLRNFLYQTLSQAICLVVSAANLDLLRLVQDVEQGLPTFSSEKLGLWLHYDVICSHQHSYTCLNGPQMYLTSVNHMPGKMWGWSKWAPAADGRGQKQTRAITFLDLVFLLERRTYNPIHVEARWTRYVA